MNRPFSDSTHAKAAEEMTADDFTWLSSLPLHICIPEYNVIVVHAGIAPGTSSASMLNSKENQYLNILLKNCTQ